MKKISTLLSLVLVLGVLCSNALGLNPSSKMKKSEVVQAASVFAGLELKTLDGKSLTEADWANKVVLVVNVASQCGFTGQYAGLQSLYSKYRSKGLLVVGVPCNQFGGQEPGTAADILAFAKKEYGVNFPLLAKQDVNGVNRSKLMERLLGASSSGGDVRWNFEKFLVNRAGQVIGRYGSSTGPSNGSLVQAIEAALVSSVR